MGTGGKSLSQPLHTGLGTGWPCSCGLSAAWSLPSQEGPASRPQWGCGLRWCPGPERQAAVVSSGHMQRPCRGCAAQRVGSLDSSGVPKASTDPHLLVTISPPGWDPGDMSCFWDSFFPQEHRDACREQRNTDRAPGQERVAPAVHRPLSTPLCSRGSEAGEIRGSLSANSTLGACLPPSWGPAGLWLSGEPSRWCPKPAETSCLAPRAQTPTPARIPAAQGSRVGVAQPPVPGRPESR